MMQMLQAGGVEPQTDGVRTADENNPKGYLEWEAIKQIQQQPELLDDPDVEARAIKVISMLLPVLPKRHDYKVIFMLRPIHQIAASQSRMIDRLDAEAPDADQELMEKRLEHHRDTVLQLLTQNDSFDFVTVDYEALLNNSEFEIKRVVDFVGDDRLDQSAMPSVIQQDLHREK